MKVKELVELLQKENQELDVCFTDGAGNLYDIGDVIQKRDSDFDADIDNDIVVMFNV